MEEIWRPVQGFEGIYEVSNLGRVKGVERRDARGWLRKEKLLSPSRVGGKGSEHLRMLLYKDAKRYPIYLHRLVAEAFIPNPERLPFVLHGDDNPENNRVDNLRWGTHQDNMNDMKFRSRHVSSNALKEFCKRGHPFDDTNTIWRRNGSRECRECKNSAQRRGFESRRISQNEIQLLFQEQGTRPSQTDNTRLYHAFRAAVKRGEDWALDIRDRTDTNPRVRLTNRVKELGHTPRSRSGDIEEERIYRSLGVHARRGLGWARSLLDGTERPWENA